MDERERTQRTPRGEEVPVPTKRDFLTNLKKVAKADETPAPDSTTSSPHK